MWTFTHTQTYKITENKSGAQRFEVVLHQGKNFLMEDQQNTFPFCLLWKDKILPSGAVISTSRSHFTSFSTFHMEDLYGCFTKLMQVKIFGFNWMQPNHLKSLRDHSVGFYQDLTWVGKYNILGNVYTNELRKIQNKTKLLWKSI